MKHLIRTNLVILIAITFLLTACDGNVRVGELEFGIEPTATLVPTATPVPTPTLTPTPAPAIETYRNHEYGFAFDYLSTWTLSEGSHAIRLQQDTLQLYIGYRWPTESVDIAGGRSGMPAGDWIYGDKVFFLGQVVPAQVLEYQRKDKAVFYGGTELIQTADLVFVVYLEDLDGAHYDQVDLSKDLQSEVKTTLESFRRIQATGGPTDPTAVPTGIPSPTPGSPTDAAGSARVVHVVGWYGSVHSAPAGSGYDDYLSVLPISSSDGVGVAEVGLAGLSPADEAAIAELRDREPPNKYAHFWGTLTCGVADYGECQLGVTHVRPDGPGPLFNPDPVEGWEGTVITSSAWAQIDDAFVLAGDYPVHYGLWSEDPALDQQLQRYRNSGIPIQVWGQVFCGVPDAGGCQIQVQRMKEAE